MKNEQTIITCPITPILLDLVYADQLDANRFASYRAHIATCPECQFALTVIDRLAQTPLAELFAEAPETSTHPTDERLLAFADAPAATAHEQYPDIAAHLADCLTCAATIAEMRDLFDVVDDDPFSAETLSTAPATQHRIWEHLAGRARRGVGPQQISIDASHNHLTFRGSLNGHVPAGGLPYAPHIISGMPIVPPERHNADLARRDAHQEPEPRTPLPSAVTPVVIDLTTPEHLYAPWVRVLLDLTAAGKRLNAWLVTSSVPYEGAVERVTAPGVAWRIEARDDDSATLLDDLHGTTDENGLAQWSIDTPGSYALIISTAGEEWEIPFIVEFTD